MTRRATDEMVTRAITAMKSAAEYIWKELKAVEVGAGHLYSDVEHTSFSDMGNKIRQS